MKLRVVVNRPRHDCEICGDEAVYSISAEDAHLYVCTSHASEAWYALLLSVEEKPKILHFESGIEMTYEEARLLAPDVEELN
jgi:hypothetical protein